MHKHKHSHHSPHGDPDRGPQMVEGEHHYDKGYATTKEREGYFPKNAQRGNHYDTLQAEIASRDEAKLRRSMRTKIS